MIRVYHAVDTQFWRESGEPVDFPANFVHVADVDAPADEEGLEIAFRLTNTIDRLWWEVPAVGRFIHPDWKGAREWALRHADVVEEKFRQPDTARAIRAKAGTAFRSTSVGDVMEMNGRRFVVHMAGFEPINGSVGGYGDVTPEGRTDIHGARRLSYKGTLPKSIMREMKKWNKGQRISFPKSYIEYHQQMAEEALDQVGMKERMKHRPGELSGGEQQRVAIARAIAHHPILVLADEPTAELDSKTGLSVINLFRELVDRLGMTIIMTTHDLSILSMMDQTIALEDGHIGQKIEE